MKILIAGSSGLIGSALRKSFEQKNDRVTLLKRSHDQEFIWPEKGLEDFDVVINLAGENISKYWSKKQKEKIVESRINTTKFLSKKLSELQKKPKVFINASAIGLYGNRGNEIVNENSSKGAGFLADVVQKWELALEPAIKANIRVVPLRTGIVLSKEGGVLQKLLPLFKLGLGGKLGSGEQYMSWISIHDMVGIVHFIIEKESIQTPVNAVSPYPVKNKEFTKILGQILKRPTFFTVPQWIIKNFLGEMGKELLLVSQKVEPKLLQQKGYTFLYPHLEGALRKEIM